MDSQAKNERQIRAELGYRPWTCNLCGVQFLTFGDAELHFRSPISRHPDQRFSVTETLDPDLEAQVHSALSSPAVKTEKDEARTPSAVPSPSPAKAASSLSSAMSTATPPKAPSATPSTPPKASPARISLAKAASSADPPLTPVRAIGPPQGSCELKTSPQKESRPIVPPEDEAAPPGPEEEVREVAGPAAKEVDLITLDDDDEELPPPKRPRADESSSSAGSSVTEVAATSSSTSATSATARVVVGGPLNLAAQGPVAVPSAGTANGHYGQGGSGNGEAASLKGQRCTKCGDSFSSRGWQRNHVLTRHLQQFTCRQCGQVFRGVARQVAVRHVEIQHARQEAGQLVEETAVPHKLLQGELAACFPHTRWEYYRQGNYNLSPSQQQRFCKPCGKWFSEAVGHVSAVHLGLVMFSCSACPYVVRNYNGRPQMKIHQQSLDHKNLVPPPTVIDHRHRHRDALNAKLRECLDQTVHMSPQVRSPMKRVEPLQF